MNRIVPKLFNVLKSPPIVQLTLPMVIVDFAIAKIYDVRIQRVARNDNKVFKKRTFVFLSDTAELKTESAKLKITELNMRREFWIGIAIVHYQTAFNLH